QVDFFQSPFRGHPEQTWPVPYEVTAAFGALLNRGLHLFDPIDARNAGTVWLAAMTLLAVWLFACDTLGRTAAAVAVACLATHPPFWGHAHNDPKDIGLTAFYSWTLVVAWWAVSRRRRAWAFVAAALLGLTLASKPNGMGVPVTLAGWFALVP